MTHKMKLAVGIDIGGTNTVFGLVDETGNCLVQNAIKTGDYPAVEDFVDGALGDCYVGNISWATVPAYDTTKVTGDAPTSMADFWDLKKYPGRRGLRKTPRVNMEWALMADGVPNDEIYNTLATEKGIDVITQFAKDTDCEGLEGIGRHGQWNWVKNKKGWKKPATFYEYIFEENK